MKKRTLLIFIVAIILLLIGSGISQKSSPIEPITTITYTESTMNVCSGNSCTKTYYANSRFVEDNGQWYNFSDIVKVNFEKSTGDLTYSYKNAYITMKMFLVVDVSQTVCTAKEWSWVNNQCIMTAPDVRTFIQENDMDFSIPIIKGGSNYKYALNLSGIPEIYKEKIKFVGLSLTDVNGLTWDDVKLDTEGKQIVFKDKVMLGFQDVLDYGYTLQLYDKKTVLIGNLGNKTELFIDPTVSYDYSDTTINKIYEVFAYDNVVKDEANSTFSGNQIDSYSEVATDNDDTYYERKEYNAGFSSGVQFNYHYTINESLEYITNIFIRVETDTDQTKYVYTELRNGDGDYEELGKSYNRINATKDITSDFQNYLYGDNNDKLYLRSYASGSSGTSTIWLYYSEVIVDYTIPIFMNETSFNDTEIEESETIRLNYSIYAKEQTIDKTWSELEYPNGTKVNYTASPLTIQECGINSDNGTCADCGGETTCGDCSGCEWTEVVAKWTHVGVVTQRIESGNTEDISLPVGTTTGDIVIVVLTSDYNTGEASIGTSGYTTILDTGNDDPVGLTKYKIMSATPDTVVSVTKASGGGRDMGAIVEVWRGVNITVPLSGTTTNYQGTSRDPDCPSMTTLSDDALVFAIGQLDDDIATVTGAPSGFTNLTYFSGDPDAGASDTGMISSYIKETAGAINPTVYVTSGTDAWEGTTFALRLGAGSIGCVGTPSCDNSTEDACDDCGVCEWGDVIIDNIYTIQFNDTTQSGQYNISWIYANTTTGTLNTTYFSDLNFTVSGDAPVDSCTCTDGQQWDVDLSDYCVLSSDCNTLPKTTTFTSVGELILKAELTTNFTILQNLPIGDGEIIIEPTEGGELILKP